MEKTFGSRANPSHLMCANLAIALRVASELLRVHSLLWHVLSGVARMYHSPDTSQTAPGRLSMKLSTDGKRPSDRGRVQSCLPRLVEPRPYPSKGAVELLREREIDESPVRSSIMGHDQIASARNGVPIRRIHEAH